MRNQWLDVCRSLAICLVLLSHGRHFLTPHWEAANNFQIGGFLGVELFFVLSGFLIGGILIEKFEGAGSGFSWIKHFWLRRWLRTVPNYVLFLVVNICLFYWGGRISDLPNLVPYLLFVQNLAWPHPDFFGEAWSLSVEEVFYFSVPLLLVMFSFTGMSKRRVMWLVAISILVFSCALRIGVAVSANPAWDAGVRKVVLFRLDSLMIGVLLALFRKSTSFGVGVVAILFAKIKRFAPYVLLSLLVPAIYMALPRFDRDASFLAKTFMFTMTSLGFAGFLMLGVGRRLDLPGEAIFKKLAAWSYSAYLANLPVFAVIDHFIGRGESLAGGVLRWLLFLVATLAISALVYGGYEKKVLVFRDRVFPR